MMSIIWLKHSKTWNDDSAIRHASIRRKNASEISQTKVNQLFDDNGGNAEKPSQCSFSAHWSKKKDRTARPFVWPSAHAKISTISKTNRANSSSGEFNASNWPILSPRGCTYENRLQAHLRQGWLHFMDFFRKGWGPLRPQEHLNWANLIAL